MEQSLVLSVNFGAGMLRSYSVHILADLAHLYVGRNIAWLDSGRMPFSSILRSNRSLAHSKGYLFNSLLEPLVG